MRGAIRCCISCILPCGVLDVIRIVHANGHVDEIAHAIRAGDVMQANPSHVLRKLPGAGPRGGPIILPPNAELQRGKIYFLMPVSSSSPPEKSCRSSTAAAETRKRRRSKKVRDHHHGDGVSTSDTARLLASSDRYLSDVLSEKVSAHRDCRRGRVGVWRPRLESISEISNDS